MQNMGRLLLFGLVLNLISGCADIVNEKVNDKFQEIDRNFRIKVELSKDSVQVLIDENKDINELKEIDNLTSEFDQYIEKFRSDLISHLSDDYNGEKVNLANFEKQMEFTIGENKQGEGYILEQRLIEYIDNINNVSTKFSFEHIVKDGSDIDAFAGTENSKKDFTTLNFEHASTVSVFATLSHYHLEVMIVELAAIKLLVEQK